MQIIHQLDDFGFNAQDIEDLKKQMQEYYSFKGYKPEIRVEGEYVIVDIDTESLEKAHKTVSKAVSLMNAHKFEDARKLLQESLKVLPHASEIYRLLAQIQYQYDRDFEAASDTCIDALRWNPKDTWALILMGNILTSVKHDNATALKYYRKALEYNPEDELATSNIAGVEMKNKNFDEAERQYNALLDKGSKAPNVYYGLTQVYYQQGEYAHAFETGIEGLKKSVETPENPSAKAELERLSVLCANELQGGVNPYHVIAALKEELEKKQVLPLEIREDKIF